MIDMSFQNNAENIMYKKLSKPYNIKEFQIILHSTRTRTKANTPSFAKNTPAVHFTLQ